MIILMKSVFHYAIFFLIYILPHFTIGILVCTCYWIKVLMQSLIIGDYIYICKLSSLRLCEKQVASLAHQQKNGETTATRAIVVFSRLHVVWRTRLHAQVNWSLSYIMQVMDAYACGWTGYIHVHDKWGQPARLHIIYMYPVSHSDQWIRL